MELVDNDEPGEEPVDVDSEPADPRDHPETAHGRIRWAMDIVEDQHRCCQSLLEDLRLATEAVCTSKQLALIAYCYLALPASINRAE